MGITAPGDMAVIVDLSRLVATGRQAQPRADRTRSLEVRGMALANKTARIVWALLARGGIYRAPALAA